MKKLLLFNFCLLLSAFYFSQNKLIDSLEKSIQTSKQDTNYVNTLNNLIGRLLGSGSLSRADSLSQAALTISEKINFKKGATLTLNLFGQIKQRQGEYGKSLEYLFKGLAISEEMKDKARTKQTPQHYCLYLSFSKK